MFTTLILLFTFIAGILLMLYSAVALIQDKKMFTSAPADIQAAIRPRTEERFRGAHALGWMLLVIAFLMLIGSIVFAVWDGVHRDWGFWQLFLRFLILLDGYKLWDIIFLDWFLLTKSRFYQHYYPETEGCRSFEHMGFNTRSQLLKLFVIFPLVSLAAAGICMLF